MGSIDNIVNDQVLGSKVNVAPKGYGKYSSFTAWAANRNNESVGEIGYRLIDVWEVALLRILAIVAKCSADTQNSWGQGWIGTGSYTTGNTQAKIVFKGTQESPDVWIDDLWGCCYCHMDSITTDDYLYVLVSPMDASSIIQYGTDDTNRYHITTVSHILDVLDCPMTIGNDVHDLMELFLAKSSVADSTRSPYGGDRANDPHTGRSTFGGNWYNTADFGLFFSTGEYGEGAYASVSARIAKN